MMSANRTMTQIASNPTLSWSVVELLMRRIQYAHTGKEAGDHQGIRGT